MFSAVAAVGVVLASGFAFAATLTVDSKASGGTPGTYATLQKAVDAAAGGDAIVVKGGEYYGRTRILKVYDKPLTIPRHSRKAICWGRASEHSPFFQTT